MKDKVYSKEEISKLIDLAHKNITRVKGKEYAPDSHEINQWINNHLNSKKSNEPNIEGEMDELQRASQDLKRDENIDISVEELIKSFEESEEQTITPNIWNKLENTESKEVKKGDINAVEKIAQQYDKTDPKILVRALKSGDYERPLILSFDGRYILVAGNTRLCTAKALGIYPKVFIGYIGEGNKELNNEATSLAQQAAIAINMKKQGKKPKSETKEETSASSSGSYEGNAFGPMITRKINKFNNADLTEQEQEIDEITGASSSGSYDVPLFGGTKGRKNPLKIDGPDSIYKGRAVKDKKFPKWGGPDSVFVKVKEKCKKFPYCNQGDTGAIELVKEDEEIKTAITETSKKYGIPYEELEKIVLNEINKIFI